MRLSNKKVMQELQLFLSTPVAVHVCILQLFIKIYKHSAKQ